MNNYLTGIEGMPRLLLNEDDPMASFKRNLYEDAFEQYCKRHEQTFAAIEAGYHQVIDKEQFIANMAAALADKAKEAIEAQPKKGKREQMMTDFNMCMVVYVLPGIRHYKGDSSEILAEAVLKAWKTAFPKTKVQSTTYEEIQGGFQRKFCYITTAVCETFGKPDDCYELTLLRNYRDGYLSSQPDGEEVIKEYYDVAPTIVKHINQREDRDKIYRRVWDQYLQPCIRMIEEAKLQECKKLYVKMVRDLEKQYFPRKSV
ncbi:MAG: CFI-box-CTERM domain-containing protein [Lachnospiraceae bacterium]|nr:hypothetical protein [Robinsoniella sp.]MDY3765437.1 CFI-box-CTERM domain-containing protein [Lachnospiraceae bacterium]